VFARRNEKDDATRSVAFKLDLCVSLKVIVKMKLALPKSEPVPGDGEGWAKRRGGTKRARANRREEIGSTSTEFADA
jgi:hypothetical protein